MKNLCLALLVGSALFLTGAAEAAPGGRGHSGNHSSSKSHYRSGYGHRSSHGYGYGHRAEQDSPGDRALRD